MKKDASRGYHKNDGDHSDEDEEESANEEDEP
jgi:hypothetical protein